MLNKFTAKWIYTGCFSVNIALGINSLADGNLFGVLNIAGALWLTYVMWGWRLRHKDD